MASEVNRLTATTVTTPFRFPSEAAQRWPGLSDDDRRIMDNLEEMAGVVNSDCVLGGKYPELADFAGTVYQVLHWVSAPHCRVNHPDWNPLRAVNGEDKAAALPEAAPHD